jgi:hypothetical protein
MAVLCTVGYAVAIFVPAIRMEMMRDFSIEAWSALWILRSLGGVAVFFVGFGILYGAIPGALVAGAGYCIRWRHVKRTPLIDGGISRSSEHAESEAENE